MSSRPLPIHIDTYAVHSNILDWTEISREEAIRLESLGVPVVATAGSHAIRFDDRCPFWLTEGSYDFSQVRYFVYRSNGPGMGSRTGGGLASGKPPAKSSSSSVSVAFEPELVPLEEPEVEAPARSTPPPAASKPMEAAKKELRFDLALDPATPGLEDDIFVLSSGDGTYNMSKTVKDDKVPGDGKLTLVFPGVIEGKSYSLSQVHDGEETVLVPEVTYGASKMESGPGEIVGCKVVFRECRIKGEKEDFYKEKESEYLIELVPATGKWVYVFGGPQGKPFKLLAEGVGLSDGWFRPVDVVKQAGKNERQPLKKSCAWMTLPLLVNGKAWELYACLSPFQLPWKRIQQLAAKPKPRCYKVGASEGAVMWAPKNVGRDVPDLLNIRDLRVKDPGKDTLLLGLVDAMAEAKRRSDIYRKRLEPYLESRFDLPMADGKPVPSVERRRKYLSGLLKVLLDQHPERARLRMALAGNGLPLDSYLHEVNEREVALKKKAEKAGMAIAKWMDHPSGLFEAMLGDYTADPQTPELWMEASEDLAYLIRYFEVSSLTRLYSRKIIERKSAWVHTHFLSEEAHQSARKLNSAAVEILSWLGKIMVQSETFDLNLLEGYYKRYVPGLEFEYRSVYSLKSKSLVADFFPDEDAPIPPSKRMLYWEALEKPQYRKETKIIWLVESSRPMEKLKKAEDSKIAKSLLYGLEGINVLLSARNTITEFKRDNIVNSIGAVVDAISLVVQGLEATKKVKNKLVPVLGLVGSAIDLYLAYRQGQEDASNKDYDACMAQIIIGAGSASLAVASGIALGSAVGAFSTGGTLFSMGAGLALTGVGAPLATIFILAGGIAVAGGTAGYMIWKDTALEGWFKTCPYGVNPKWKFEEETKAASETGALSGRLFPWKVHFQHAFLHGSSDYLLSLQGPFSPYTKVTVHGFDFIDESNQSTRFLQEEVLRPVESKNLRIRMDLENPASLTLSVKDSACWAAHRTRFPQAKNGFKYCRVHMTVDQHGDGLIVWGPGEKGDPILFDANG